MNYEQEVKSIYPEATLKQEYNIFCDYLPVGVSVMRWLRLWFIPIPIRVFLGFGNTEEMAWKHAYERLKQYGKIK